MTYFYFLFNFFNYFKYFIVNLKQQAFPLVSPKVICFDDAYFLITFQKNKYYNITIQSIII